MAVAKAEASEKERISVEKAAQAARLYFSRLFPTVRNFSLEEVELSDDGKYWMITLGYTTTTADERETWTLPKTKFKVFKVDAMTGNVLSMKIRSLA